ncbi:MAG: hypothetical protein KJO87_03700 [Acidimicrobiia bacterium]|nr:hypothetical protein [Acidimicrobiia bacterium]
MEMTKRTWLLVGLLAIVLAACAPGSDAFAPDDRANFFHGVWHGWIAPFTLIWQIFNSDIRVYEPNNTGWWYDFGFYIAVISGFGSLALSRRKQRKQRRKAG